MIEHDRTYLERALAARFAPDASRFLDLADRVADIDATLEQRASALADIAQWLDHAAGHPEEGSPTGNLVEIVLVGVTEALCPELIGSLRAHWMAEP